MSKQEILEYESSDNIFDSIIYIIKNYMEKNKKNEIKLKEKLNEIFYTIKNILNLELDKESKNELKNIILILKVENEQLKNQIRNLEEKAIFIPEEEEEREDSDIKSTLLYLKSKLKEKDERIKINELNYLYYIEEQNKKITDLENQLFKISLKHLSKKKINQIRLFPNLKQYSEKEVEDLKYNMKKLPIHKIKSDVLLTSRNKKTRNNSSNTELKQTFSANNIHNHNQIRLKYDFKDYQEKDLTGRLREQPKHIEQYRIYNKIKEFNNIISHHHNHLLNKRPLKISLKLIKEKIKKLSNS